MTTDLFLFGGPAPVPPECRRPPAPLPRWQTAEPDVALLELPPLAPRAPATRVIPSLSLLTDRPCSFRFEARTTSGAPWTPLAPVGPHRFPDLGADPALVPDIDFYSAEPPAVRLDLRLRLHSPALAEALRAPALVAVSLSDSAPADLGPAAMPAAQLAVPARSQLDAPEPIRHRACSPASVAMVLGYWQRPAPLDALAAEMFDARHDLYGVWPAAIGAAARRGVHGYLLRFPSWAAAAWCLAEGIPVVASVRYAEGELPGAAVGATAGHLLVLTGYDGDVVAVNDPAAPAVTVPRRYPRAAIARVWLGRAGVGYVLFDPGARA